MSKTLLLAVFLVAAGLLAGRSIGDEPSPVTPTLAPGNAKFLIKSIARGEGFEAVRLNVQSGQTSVLRGTKWVKMAEDGQVPAGNYDLEIGTTAQNKYYVIRYNRDTGAAWTLYNDKMNAIAEERAE